MENKIQELLKTYNVDLSKIDEEMMDYLCEGIAETAGEDLGGGGVYGDFGIVYDCESEEDDEQFCDLHNLISSGFDLENLEKIYCELDKYSIVKDKDKLMQYLIDAIAQHIEMY